MILQASLRTSECDFGINWMPDLPNTRASTASHPWLALWLEHWPLAQVAKTHQQGPSSHKWNKNTDLDSKIKKNICTPSFYLGDKQFCDHLCQYWIRMKGNVITFLVKSHLEVSLLDLEIKISTSWGQKHWWRYLSWEGQNCLPRKVVLCPLCSAIAVNREELTSLETNDPTDTEWGCR